MGKVYDTSMYWLQLGIATIPIGWKSKQPLVRWLPYTEQLPTENEIGNWFASDLTNIGIVTGWKNLCIVDFDDMDVFLKWYQWAVGRGGKAKEIATHTRIHKSARGAHVYILSEKAENMKLSKIDILAHRKYALLPPSLHPTGARYEIYRDALPMPVKSLYDVLPKALLDNAVQKSAQAPAPTSNIPSGQQAWNVSGTYDPWAEAGKDDQQTERIVDRIKAEIPVTSILSGPYAKSTNGWLMIRCPFHDDKNPSMWINADRTLCGCNAGCTPLPLDVINLYARLHNISNEDAIHQLAERL